MFMFVVTLQNLMHGYEWGPRDFTVEADTAEDAIAKARELANDCYADCINVTDPHPNEEDAE